MGGLNPIAEFREDHRKVRDGILEITDALGRRDMKKAKEIIDRLNILVGPHFRYEEEHLYPALRRFLGEYVDQLRKEHDDVISTAKACVDLLSNENPTEREAEEAKKAAMALLIHVSNCDGLAILASGYRKKSFRISAIALTSRGGGEFPCSSGPRRYGDIEPCAQERGREADPTGAAFFCTRVPSTGYTMRWRSPTWCWPAEGRSTSCSVTGPFNDF
jgi:hemerythrin